MTDEFDLMKELFHEDAEPSGRSWATLRSRIGVGDGAESPSDAPTPEIWLTDETAAKAPRSIRRRVILAGVAASVLVAFGIVSVGAFSRQDTVRSALASLFGSPTLKVVFSLPRSDAYPKLAGYSLALTVTSENGSEPLSGSDAADAVELSLFQGSNDVVDVIVADGVVYGRLDLEALSPSSYESASQSILKQVGSGAAYTLAEAAINGGWVGVDDATIGSYLKNSDVRSTGPSLATDRNAAAMSFAQAWDALASMQEVSSANGTTEYSIDIPARVFVSSFVEHLQAALAKDVPNIKNDISLDSFAVRAIPASVDIPLDMWVSGGSLTAVDVSYKSKSLDMAISHPSVGVTAPTNAVMVTSDIVTTLENDYNTCVVPYVIGPILVSPPISLPPTSVKSTTTTTHSVQAPSTTSPAAVSSTTPTTSTTGPPSSSTTTTIPPGVSQPSDYGGSFCIGSPASIVVSDLHALLGTVFYGCQVEWANHTGLPITPTCVAVSVPPMIPSTSSSVGSASTSVGQPLTTVPSTTATGPPKS